MLRPVADVSTFGIAPDRLGPLTASLKAALAGETAFRRMSSSCPEEAPGVRGSDAEARNSWATRKSFAATALRSVRATVDIGPLRPDTPSGGFLGR